VQVRDRIEPDELTEFNGVLGCGDLKVDVVFAEFDPAVSIKRSGGSNGTRAVLLRRSGSSCAVGQPRRIKQHDAVSDRRRSLERTGRGDVLNRHTENVVVYVPAAPAQYGIAAHKEFALNSFRAFPDQRVQNRPYKAFFAGGDWVCSSARFTGTMTGPMVRPDETEIPPTGKSFDVDFCTVGHWKNRQMVEEYLFYDVVTFVQQIGVSG
jgi:predicted ester cyclase